MVLRERVSPGAIAGVFLVAASCGGTQHSSATEHPSSIASSARLEPTPCSDIQTPRFTAPAPSNRNVEIIQFKGSETYIIRDITDILHPATIATVVARYPGPQFVGGGEVSFVDNAGLELMKVPGSTKTLVSRCAGLFAWSPDGSTLAFVANNEELHLVTGGQNRVVASMPIYSGGIGCESQRCGDEWESRLSYSPNDSYLSLVQWPPGEFRIWASDGKVVAGYDYTSPGPDSPRTMLAWSGDVLYFRDNKGVEMWRAGTVSLLLPGVDWVRPHASPAGGQIVFETRDTAGMALVHLLDTASGKVRDVASARSEPAFLNAHLIWYQEERACQPKDNCVVGPMIATGRTFIYDLADGTETESKIARVFDVWPHPA